MDFDTATKNLCHVASTLVLSADDRHVNQHGEKMITVNADLWMRLKQAVADKASAFPDTTNGELNDQDTSTDY